MLHTRTKIVATAGPALDAPGVLEGAIEAGIDVLRVNLSHGSPRDQLPRIQRARLAYPEIAVIADLCGPKLRLGELPAPVDLAVGSQVVLGIGGLPVADPDFWRRVHRGDPIYLADGLIRLAAEVVAEGSVMCRILAGGPVTSHKGINLPNDTSELPCLTAKDRRDLLEIDAIAPDFIALSYVRHEDDIATLKTLCSQPVIAKIEKQQALERLDAILAAADGLMVARGDLGVEIPIERIASTQKRLMRRANRLGKPVITATQMLESMTANRRPTRAEATDVANAILDGTDCVMLSAESAMGSYPAEAVEMLAKIAEDIEPQRPSSTQCTEPDGAREGGLAGLIALSVEGVLRRGSPSAVVVPTFSGKTARDISRFRPAVWVVAVSPLKSTCQALQLSWGVYPELAPEPPDDWTTFARNWLRSRGIEGDLVVLTEGPSQTNARANHRLELLDLRAAES
jgi:pyruvate kinase